MRMPKNIPFINTYKYTKRFEMAVSLFEACNMQCDFCFQNQKSQKEIITPKKIMDAYPIIQDYLDGIVKTKDIEAIDLKLWGGEIFSDNLSDDVINSYAELIKKLQKKIAIPFAVVFLSNGMHTKYNRIENMIKTLNVSSKKIILSYDSVGRFNHLLQKKLFIKTMNYYISKNLFGGLSIVLSKPAINAYISGDEFFTNIQPNIPIYGNYYIANNKWPIYLPSWKDIFKFFRYCIENKKFNIDIIENIFRGLIPETQHTVIRMCNCNEAAQYNSSDGYCSSNCINDRIRDIDLKKYFYGNIYNEITNENQFFTRSYLLAKKNKCYTCEHFLNCTQMCGASVIFKEYNAEKCPINELIKTITKKDIADFKKYFWWKYGEKI